MRKLILTCLCGATAALASAAVDATQLKQAVDLLNQRKLPEAQQALEALARADTSDPEVQFQLGRLSLQKDNAEQAIDYFLRATALAPKDSRYQQRLGDAYGRAAQKASLFSQMGLAKKCKAAYEKAVELNNRNLDARQALVNFHLQAPGIAGGSVEKAQALAEETKQFDPPRGRQMLAAVYSNQKKYDLAFAEFEEVLRDKPDDYTSLYQVGRLAASSGQSLDRGLATLRRCVEMTVPEGEPGHAAAWWRIGNILEKKSDKAGARAAYESSLKADPKFPQAIDSLKKLSAG